jgi:hypothetical protein
MPSLRVLLECYRDNSKKRNADGSASEADAGVGGETRAGVGETGQGVLAFALHGHAVLCI